MSDHRAKLRRKRQLDDNPWVSLSYFQNFAMNLSGGQPVLIMLPNTYSEHLLHSDDNNSA